MGLCLCIGACVCAAATGYFIMKECFTLTNDINQYVHQFNNMKLPFELEREEPF